MKLLIATDGSKASQGAVKYAARCRQLKNTSGIGQRLTKPVTSLASYFSELAF
jgi:hypothetical protein